MVEIDCFEKSSDGWEEGKMQTGKSSEGETVRDNMRISRKDTVSYRHKLQYDMEQLQRFSDPSISTCNVRGLQTGRCNIPTVRLTVTLDPLSSGQAPRHKVLFPTRIQGHSRTYGLIPVRSPSHN